MMRILYISPYLGHYNNAVGETSRQIVRELRNAGTEVVTFPSTDPEGSRCGPAVGSNHVYRQLIRKFSTRYLPGRLRAYFLEFFLVARALGFRRFGVAEFGFCEKRLGLTSFWHERWSMTGRHGSQPESWGVRWYWRHILQTTWSACSAVLANPHLPDGSTRFCGNEPISYG